MSLVIRKMESDVDMERFALFFMKYRNLLSPPYSIPFVMRLASRTCQQGHAFLAFDEQEEVAAMVTYFIGTPERKFEDPSCALIEMAIIRPDCQGSPIFLRGLAAVLEDLRARASVEEVIFYAQEDLPYHQQLYSKFSRQTAKKAGPNGMHDTYSIPLASLLANCDRWMRRLQPRRREGV